MDEDFDLGTICELTPRNESHIVKFFANLSFGDELDPCKNNKFPGSMVVSIARKDLPTIRGFPMQHIPYKPCEIFSWMHPLTHQIPPLTFPYFVKPNLVSKPETEAKSGLTLDTLDFGGSNGYFDTFVPMFVDWKDLGF